MNIEQLVIPSNTIAIPFGNKNSVWFLCKTNLSQDAFAGFAMCIGKGSFGIYVR